MDFAEAMRAVMDGMSVRRRAWDDAHCIIRLRLGLIEIMLNHTWRPWLISDVDVKAKDWELE